MERDQVIFDLIEREHQRQLKGMELIASENFVPTTDNFESETLAMQWNTIHPPVEPFYSLTERPGFLRLSTRPKVLEADVVRFQNNKEKWVAFVGLLDGYPYEIFTGLQDDDEGIILPKNVSTGHIIKNVDENGNKRYDFQFENKRGYKVTIEGLSEKFNKEYWNYAKLISGVLRYRMPIEHKCVTNFAVSL